MKDKKNEIGTKDSPYCYNRKCEKLDCCRYYKNIPFNVLVWQEEYQCDSNGECEAYCP